MRKILLLLLILPMLSFAQTDTTNFTWTIVNNAPGNKDQLFSKAQEWTVSILKNPKAAMQIQDREGGRIVVNTNFGAGEYSVTVFCTIEVDVKDGKYKFSSYSYIAKDLSNDIEWGSLSQKKSPLKYTFWGKSRSKGEWINIKNDAINVTKSLYQSLFAIMNKKSDNW